VPNWPDFRKLSKKGLSKVLLPCPLSSELLMKKALVCGAGGFIGGHLVRRLKLDGFWVRGVDLKTHEYQESLADEFVVADLREQEQVRAIIDCRFDEVYQLAADMGGAGYIFSGENDASIMHNSASINLNVIEACRKMDSKRVFYSSSACIYPAHNQTNPSAPKCSEDSAYPADPDSEYGWEKLFSERLYLSYNRNHGMACRIARLHNIFGPEGAWDGGKEKAPAAICRKVAAVEDEGIIEIWGDGEQTRSFLYIDECIEGILRLMRSSFDGPVNIGSCELISINDLARMAFAISGKNLSMRHIQGPTGVRGRNSDNTKIQEMLNWVPSQPLRLGMEATYAWIADQVEKRNGSIHDAPSI